jgi:peptide chain release factor 3
MSDFRERRTFAIISHPDAGKTTLTEKLLLYGGAVRLAGTVTARKHERATASDWMELEKQRGISISSTVLQFDYDRFRINLLDTPGHRDFSEDTYRVLTAVDAAIMVIDAAKGIEPQTRKLFEVCRRRGVPIFTFINKLDRPAREPLDLLDELEKVLGLTPFPMNWPLGAGPGFRGVFERLSKQVHLFERTPAGAFKAPRAVMDHTDPLLAEKLLPEDYTRFMDEAPVLDVYGETFEREAVLEARKTPVFFGSAVNNFGVQLLLDGFLRDSPPPVPRAARNGVVPVESPVFSAFIFKIQANMDPRHRDRVAFARVCSGRFTRDMAVHHSATGRMIRLSNSHKLFGQEREIVDEAWPGDIVGLVGHTDFRIGDTLTEDPKIIFDEIPRFPPECFGVLHNANPSKFKPFRKGLDQLIKEGLVQSFHSPSIPPTAGLLAAVGPLQFEVLQYRLQSEYGVESRIESTPWQIVRWVGAGGRERLDASAGYLPNNVTLAEDADGRPVIFFPTEWAMNYFIEKNPLVPLSELPPGDAQASDAGTHGWTNQ